MADHEHLRHTLHICIDGLNRCESDARELGDANLSLALQRAREGACLAMYRLGQIVGEELQIPRGAND